MLRRFVVLALATLTGCTSAAAPKMEPEILRGSPLPERSGKMTAFLARAAADSHLLVVGEAHQNHSISRDFSEVLRETERFAPGRLKAVGLEVFSVYQPAIDKYLGSAGRTADERGLLDTPDREALRGTRDKITETGERIPSVSANFLKIFRTVFELNRRRPATNKIRVVALDERPDTGLTFREYQKDHMAMLQWAFARDPKMFSRIEPEARRAVAGNGLVLILIGSAHAQRSGRMEFILPEGFPVKVEPVTWLGTRLAEAFPKVLTATLIDPDTECQDRVQLALIKEKVQVPLALDLRRSSLGEIANFQCHDFPMGIKVNFVPENYRAREHYDLYGFFPKG